MAATADGQDAAILRRQRSMKHREFGMYASLPQTPQTSDSNSASDVQPPDSISSMSSPSPFTASFSSPTDGPPQIPPFTISPRWESFDRKDTPSPPTLPAPPSLDNNRDTTTEYFLQHARNELDELTVTKSRAPGTSTPTGSRPPTADKMVENFSRPRKSSIKQPAQDMARQRLASGGSSQPDPAGTGEHHLGAMAPPPKARERGLSTSSSKSSSTFASMPSKPSAIDYIARMRTPAAAATSAAGVTRPQLAYSRTESNGSALSREPIAWLAKDEVRSSFRSQLTVSTTLSTNQGTLLTERSSVMTKSSSVTSVYASVDEGLSVEDVMGMYEKGFHDDSEMEDHAEESRPPTARSELSRRGAQILEAMNEPLPVPSLARPIQIQVRDSAAMFRNSGLPSSLPKGVGNLDYHMGGKAGLGQPSRHDAAGSSDHLAGSSAPPKRPRRPDDSQAETEARDRYGFRKQTQHVTREQYDAWCAEYEGYLARRRRKWVAFLKDSGLATEPQPDRFPPRSAKTKRFVRKGIPPEWRGAAWFYYAGGPQIVARHPGLYDELTRRPAKDLDAELIERDLHRTFPDNIKFRPPPKPKAEGGADAFEPSESSRPNSDADGSDTPEETPLITSLRRVLRAFAVYNPRIGYCQSLNFLAGMLLLFVEGEEQAFWLLNVITRLYLPGTHEVNLEGSRIDLGVLMAELRESLPQVWTKIGGELDGGGGLAAAAGGPAAAAAAQAEQERQMREAAKKRSSSRRKETSHGPPSRNGTGLSTNSVERLPPITLCMTAWFMSCFIGTLPVETTLRVWDVFFYEGSKTLFRIALAIFKHGEAEIRAVSDPMEMFGVVQSLPRRILDANALMETCFRRRGGFGGLSQDTIERGRQERREAGRWLNMNGGGGGEDAAGAKDAADEAGAEADVEDGIVANVVTVEVRRKGTLFGRRKERGRDRERDVDAL